MILSIEEQIEWIRRELIFMDEDTTGKYLNDISILEGILSSLEELDNLREEHKTLENMNGNLQNIIYDLEEDRSNEAQNTIRLEKEIESLEGMLDDLRDDFKDLSAEYRSLEDDYVKLEEQYINKNL